jgi:ubiquinone biosynthesis protein
VHATGDGDGAHARHADQPDRPLRDAGRRHQALSRDGVEIFFTQVFRDGFFHADMHPGNIQVSHRPRHLRPLHRAGLRHRRHADRQRQELPGAELPAFFRATTSAWPSCTSKAGWVPPRPASTNSRRHPRRLRADLRPAAEGHLAGQVLLRLFQTSRRFNVEIQPQLVLLQKTLLNIEGPGPPARSRAGPVEHRQALPGALDERAAPHRLRPPSPRTA